MALGSFKLEKSENGLIVKKKNNSITKGRKVNKKKLTIP